MDRAAVAANTDLNICFTSFVYLRNGYPQMKGESTTPRVPLSKL